MLIEINDLKLLLKKHEMHFQQNTQTQRRFMEGGFLIMNNSQQGGVAVRWYEPIG